MLNHATDIIQTKSMQTQHKPWMSTSTNPKTNTRTNTRTNTKTNTRTNILKPTLGHALAPAWLASGAQVCPTWSRGGCIAWPRWQEDQATQLGAKMVTKTLQVGANRAPRPPTLDLGWPRTGSLEQSQDCPIWPTNLLLLPGPCNTDTHSATLFDFVGFQSPGHNICMQN